MSDSTTLPLPALTSEALGGALERLRSGAPLVQCLTNIVVANMTANVLLAAGAAPAMVDNPAEAGLFAQVAGGVLVNTGTPYEETTRAMESAVRAAAEHGTPWVLDPVAAGGLPWRTATAVRLLGLGSPAIVRGNASEILGLTGGAGGRGVDATDAAEGALPAATDLAAAHGCAVAVSGPVDVLTDGERVVRIANGHPWMTRVTGVGCSLGALMAAYAAVCDDALVAAAAATAHATIAADLAADVSAGPGSFAVAWIDELAALSPELLAERVRFA